MPMTDFNFLFGDWRVENRRLKARLAGCDEWEHFMLDYQAQPLLFGGANMDRIYGDCAGAAFEGVSVRTFDAAADEWTIYWMDSISVRLSEQVRGRFVDGVGIFEGEDEHDGRPCRLRIRWDAREPAEPIWDQALWDESACAWEVNWEMRFSRRDAD